MTHICVSKLTIIGSDHGLSPDRWPAIIWTNAGLLLIGPLGTNFNEILIDILTFSFRKMRWKVSSAKRRPFCLGFNVLIAVMWEGYSCDFILMCALAIPLSRLPHVNSRSSVATTSLHMVTVTNINVPLPCRTELSPVAQIIEQTVTLPIWAGRPHHRINRVVRWQNHNCDVL